MTEPADEIRERAKAPLHEALHALNPRIPNLNVGDCHCNLLAEVAIDALMPILADAGMSLPPDGDVREEWATRHLDIESTQRVVTACRDRFEAERMFEYFDEVWGHHTELISRTVHTGPWRVVDPEGAPDGA